MTFVGVYLTARWLPGKRLVLADSTYDGYRRNVERHVVPALGGIALRRLRPDHLEALYERLLHPNDGSSGLAPKTVYEVHLVIRGRLWTPLDADSSPQRRPCRPRTPLRSIPKVEQQAWTADGMK